jgi:hypothetical protein
VEERTVRLLRETNDVLFRAGGCHVFALALAEKKGLPLLWVHEDGGTYDHVACAGGDGVIVDFFGWFSFTEFCRADWIESRAIRFSPIAEADVRARFVFGPSQGYYALPEFFEPAADRARAWIQKHDDIFSGRNRIAIPGVSRLQTMDDADAIFGQE